MSKDPSMVRQIEFIVVVRRIKLLGIAITTGIIVIYLSGLLVANNNHRENFDTVNLFSLFLLLFFFVIAFFVRKQMLRKVNLSNIADKYFNAHVIPFAILDLGALFCLTTNLYVNANITYATIGVVISVAGMILSFPSEEHFEKLKDDFDFSDVKD